jgi:putative phosphoesterase
MLYVDQKTIFATHGHLYNESNLPPLKKGDILLHGHTHVSEIRTIGDITYINPGSVSIPKEKSTHSYMIFSQGEFILYEFN